MKSSLYATPTDILQFLEDFEASRSIYYWLAGPSEGSCAERWENSVSIPGLGIAEGPQTSLCKSYLVTKRSAEVVSRKVMQVGGGALFFADQLVNPESLVLTPGGIWRSGMIVAGMIGTVHENPSSRSLMGAARGSLRRNFRKVKSFWVGPEALLRLRSGERLTIAEQSPSSFDLRLE
jgi:hypothetical protein